MRRCCEVARSRGATDRHEPAQSVARLQRTTGGRRRCKRQQTWWCSSCGVVWRRGGGGGRETGQPED